MRHAFSQLHEKKFDVVIIGGGINGSSAAQNLTAAGYKCLVVDKGDFASGSSGRSSRMLHIGLRYFEAEQPVTHFGLHPRRFVDALRMAREAMLAVDEHMQTAGNRVWPYKMCFPIYRRNAIKGWHVSAGISLLKILGGGRVALNYEMVKRDFSSKIPFFDDFRDSQDIQSVACYNEFKFDWPERFCIDMLNNAEQNGATLLNYCKAQLHERDADNNWIISLHSVRDPDQTSAQVKAPLVLNMAGPWIDDVLSLEKPKSRIVQGTKGAHIAVELPKTYRGFGIATLSRQGQPFYILPMGGNLYSVGVTETLFEGDATDVSSTDEEIDFLIEESNYWLPGRQLSRRDVLKTWAGVRPLTFSESEPMGLRSRELHDLEDRGYPGVFAMTAGPIMSHRSAGRLILDKISTILRPSGPKGNIDFTPYEFSQDTNSPQILKDEPDIRITDIAIGATTAHAQTLEDVLLRRTGLAWRRNLSRDEVEAAAKIVGPILKWSREEELTQISEYLACQENTFRRPSIEQPESN